MTTTHVQSEDGAEHEVCLNALRVIISRDSECWIAQGIDVDYAAYGSTLEEAKGMFGEGLARTIGLYVAKAGSIEGMLRVAPKEARIAHMTMTQQHAYKVDFVAFVGLPPSDFPYRELAFVQPEDANLGGN